MKRRRFLITAGLGGAVVALTFGKFFTTPFEEAAEIIIRRELYFLRLDGQGLKNFAADYSAAKHRNYKLIVKGYSLIGISAAQSGKVHQLVSQYLLSTDFFRNRMDESRLIKYLALYNPYTNPCAHPFSAAQHPDSNA